MTRIDDGFVLGKYIFARLLSAYKPLVKSV